MFKYAKISITRKMSDILRVLLAVVVVVVVVGQHSNLLQPSLQTCLMQDGIRDPHGSTVFLLQHSPPVPRQKKRHQTCIKLATSKTRVPAFRFPRLIR